MQLVMAPKITGRDRMSVSRSETEFSEVLPPYLPPHTSSSVRIEGLVVVVGSCGGTDSGT